MKLRVFLANIETEGKHSRSIDRSKRKLLSQRIKIYKGALVDKEIYERERLNFDKSTLYKILKVTRQRNPFHVRETFDSSFLRPPSIPPPLPLFPPLFFIEKRLREQSKFAGFQI